MSKTISYKGQLVMGGQDKIKLSTMNGKTGYKITKFNIIPKEPGSTSSELIVQIFKTDQTGNIGRVVDFTNSDLLAVAYYEGNSGSGTGYSGKQIIFDNEKINQDIFISAEDGNAANTTPANYYIELESMALSDIEATYLTLQSIRDLTS
jgi:hypothetical protein